MAKKTPGMMDFVRVLIESLEKRRRVPPEERRTHTRHDLWQENDLIVLRPTTSGRQVGDRFTVYLRNVSRSGLGFVSREVFGRGEIVGVELAMGGGTRRVWCEVVRCESHSSFVSNKMLRMNDVGAKFCADYRRHFVEGLQSGDRTLRHRVGQALVDSGDTVGEELFADLVSSDLEEVRCEGLCALAKAGTGASVKSLLLLLSRSDVVELPQRHPLRPVLASTGLLRDQNQLPREGEQRVTVDVDGRSFLVTVLPEQDDRFVAVCPDVAGARVAAETRADALALIRERLGQASPDAMARTVSDEAKYVFLADLAAQALQAITGLDVAFDGSAPTQQRLSQRQAWVQQSMQWLKAQAADEVT